MIYIVTYCLIGLSLFYGDYIMLKRLGLWDLEFNEIGKAISDNIQKSLGEPTDDELLAMLLMLILSFAWAILWPILLISRGMK